jgi:hypothetical protein
MPRSEEEASAVMGQISEAMNQAIKAVFGETGLPDDLSMVAGFKFEGEHGCHLISNINVCGMEYALDEMHHAAVQMHVDMHGNHEVTEVVPEGSVPTDVRQTAEMIAEAVGAEQIIYSETVDASDLADLPEAPE